MIEVSILLSVINQMGRNVASIFCHEIIKKFPAEPLVAARGALVEKHCTAQCCELVECLFLSLAQESRVPLQNLLKLFVFPALQFSH